MELTLNTLIESYAFGFGRVDEIEYNGFNVHYKNGDKKATDIFYLFSDIFNKKIKIIAE